MTSPARLDVVERWGRLNESIVALVDCIPDDKWEWSPRDDLWTLRQLVGHIAIGRHIWLDRVRCPKATLAGGEPDGSIATLTEQLHLSWSRLEQFFSSQANLDQTYEAERRGHPITFSGHWAAFHMLEHDVHHRADIFHYLALLEVEHPDVGTP